MGARWPHFHQADRQACYPLYYHGSLAVMKDGLKCITRGSETNSSVPEHGNIVLQVWLPAVNSQETYFFGTKDDARMRTQNARVHTHAHTEERMVGNAGEEEKGDKKRREEGRETIER